MSRPMEKPFSQRMAPQSLCPPHRGTSAAPRWPCERSSFSLQGRVPWLTKRNNSSSETCRPHRPGWPVNQLQEYPASVPELESSLRDLENANRLLVHDSGDADQAWRAEWAANSSGPEKGKTLLGGCGLGIEQGLASYWQATNDQPYVHVGDDNGKFLQQSTTWLALALGGLLFWLVSPWASPERLAAWRPELSALWGLVAGLLLRSWLLAIVCIGVALLWRLALLGLALTVISPKPDRAKPSSSNAPIPG